MPGVTGGPVNIADHRFLAQDDLRDGAIQNIAAYLSAVGAITPNGVTAGAGGALAAGSRFTNTSAVAIGATETLIVAVPLQLPTTVYGQSVLGTLNAGSTIKARFVGTYTSAGAQTVTLTLRAGTNGTTADTSLATVSITSATSGTAIPFTLDVDLNFRTIGTSGTFAGGVTLVNKGTTGIFTAAADAETIASTTINTTTPTFLDFTLLAGTGNSASILAYQVEVLP